MNSFFILTKILMKNASVFRKSGNRRYGIGLLAGVIAILALIVSSTVIFLNLYDPVAAYHLDGTVLSAILSATCIVLVVFGILYVISIYYFSDDIIQLITLPIAPQKILAAKFVIVSIYQYILEAVILLPCIVAFGIKKANLSFWIFSILVFLVLPVIPTVVCSLISLLIMSFGKFFKNKDRVKLVSGILAFAAAIGINIALQVFNANSISVYSLADSGALMKKTEMLFPSSIFAINAIESSSPAVGILQFALFFLISVGAVFLFLLLGNAFYINGVIGLTQRSVSGKRFTIENYGKHMKRHNAVLAIAMKDWKLLYRTPAYFLNCVLSALLFPILVVVILGFSLKEIPLPSSNPMVISVCVIIITFLCTMNGTSPTAISREGRDFPVTSYIPVAGSAQITAKLLPGLLLSIFDVVLVVPVSCIFFKFTPLDAGMIFLLSLISTTSFNLLGLFFDINFPKLEWDDETAAVKNNLNIILQMVTIILLLGLITFFVNFLKLNYFAGVLFLFIAMMLLLAVSAFLLFKTGKEIFSGSRSTAHSAPHETGDRRKIVTTAATIIFVALTAVFMFQENNISVEVTISSAKVDINAGIMESSSFETTQIKSTYLKDTIPALSNRNGYAAGEKCRGIFTVEGIGRGHVYMETNKGPFLYVILKDGSFTIFNYSDSTKTNRLYEKLKEIAPGSVQTK